MARLADLGRVGLHLTSHPQRPTVGGPGRKERWRLKVAATEAELFGGRGDEAVGVVGHDAGDTGFDQKAHVGGLIYGPADDLQVLFSGFGEERRCDQIAADGELTGANFDGELDWVFHLALEEKSRHQGWLDFAERLENRRVERNHDGARDFAGAAQST